MSERVEQLLQAGNEASARVRNLWITFLLFGTYLAIAIGGTTHRQMLLESPIVLPILGAELPLVDFYRIAPGLFLVFHFYMLVQLYLLADKLRKFDRTLVYPPVTRGAEEDLRTRTDNFLITQLLVGRQLVLLVRMFIWLAAWLTMVVAPVVLLLAFQIRFLPYHDVLTTWIQRAFLITDILLVWLLWPAVTSREGGLGGAVVALFWKPWVGLYRTLDRTAKNAAASYRSGDFRTYLKVGFAGYAPFRRTWNQFLYNLFWAILTIVASVAVIGFSVLVATIPAEPIERWLLASWEPLRQRALDDEAMRRCLDFDAGTGWQDNWWLPGLIRQDEEQASGCTYLLTGIGGSYLAVEPWFSKRPRDRSVPGGGEPVWWPTYLLFEGEADDVSSKTSSLFSRNLVLIDDFDLVKLDDEALKKADGTLVLRGRDLRYARFDRSDLRKADLLKAKLTGAVMQGTRLDNANLSLAEMQGANLSKAEMQGANLSGARMQGANLIEASMQGANLSGASMQGANLRLASMQGANLPLASMQGANLPLASMQGANLLFASMQGANLRFARMQGANLRGARMQGADLGRARMQGADLREAGMQGANLRGASMQGANLRFARMQGANLSEASMQGADLREAGLWMAVAEGTNLEWVDTRAANNEDPFTDADPAQRAEKAATAVDRWLDVIPEGEAREAARERFATLRDPFRGPGGWRPWADAENLTPPGQWNGESEAGLSAFLAELGCRVDNAPHVARGLLLRMRLDRTFRDGRLHHPLLAKALLAPDCSGAKGLTDEELAHLRAIDDGNK